MKRWMGYVLSAALLLSATACGGAKAPTADAMGFDEAALCADAEGVVKSMQNGDFASVAAKFDKTMAAALTADGLKDGWEQTVASLGAYQAHISTDSAEQDGYFAVVLVEQYEGNGLQVRVVYSPDGEISGLRCSYADLSVPEESDLYQEADITVTGDPALPLSGVLTLPTGVEQPPVVILIHGSGSSDRNENVYGNKPFADIAHGLAEAGVASIRYDKRYFTYPDSGAALGAALTLEDEVLEDAYAAIVLAQSDGRVDGSRVYVLGHSLGGMLVPAIAAAHPELSGVISMAGTLRPLWEVSYDQNQEAIAAIDVSQLSAADKATMDAQTAQIEADIAVLRGDFGALADETMLMGIPAGYWKSLKVCGGTNYIEQVSMPMLILQGDADFQVFASADYPLWQETLAGRDNVTFHLYEGLNHLLMPTQGKRDLSEYQVVGKVAPQVIADIAAFVTEN